MSKHSKKDNIRHRDSQHSKGQSTRPRFWHKHTDWTALGVLFLLLVIFFYPIVFSNKTLMPPDRIASMSFKNFVPQTIPSAIKNHNYPLWDPYIFSGMPSFASLTMPFIDIVNDVVLLTAGGIQYLIQWIHPIDLKTPFYILFNYLLLGGFVFLLLRSRKLSIPASLFAAVAMVFMPQAIVYAAFGHHTKLATVVLIPLVFLLAERLLEKQNLLFLCLAGLALGVQFLRAHVQISYYTHLVIGLYFVYWTFCAVRDKEKFGRVFRGGLLLLGGVLAGVLVSSWMNLSVWEYSRYSIRGGGEAGGVGYDYATGWSFPPSEIATFFIPSFMGFGGETYWGAMPFTDFPLYFGILVFLLAGLAVALNRNRTVWFFSILAGLSLLASFGKHLPILYAPMYKLLPLFNKFRAPNMIHILLEFSMVVLAAYGFQAVLDFPDQARDKLKRAKRYLWVFGGVLGVLVLILLFGKSAYLNWAQKAGDSRVGAYDLATEDAVKSVVLYAAAILAILSAMRKKMGATGFAVLMIGLMVVDFWMVDRRFVHFQPKANEQEYFAETPEVAYLKGQKGPFRILPLQDGRSPNWYMYHLIQSVYGYHAAKLKIYQEALDAFQMPDAFLMKYVKVVDQQYVLRKPEEIPQTPLKAHRAFLRLFNVRYLVCPFAVPDSTFRMVFPPAAQGLPAVFEFTGFLPRVFFPKRVMQVQGKEAVLSYMAGGSFDPEDVAILNDKPPFEVSASDSNRAEISSWGNHRIEILARTRTPSLLTLSEIYYPAGWKAFVDGRETTIYKTDYVLRSVFLEPGTHKVEMIFRPRMFRVGLTVTLASFGLLLLGAAVGLRLNRKPKPAEPEVESN